MDIFSRPIQSFSLIKLHATESQESLNEVSEGVAVVLTFLDVFGFFYFFLF